MTKQITILLAALIIALSSCGSAQKAQTAAYTPLDHYFVSNEAPASVPSAIFSQADFEHYFGQAAVMGKNGEPTAVDFGKEFVIAVVLPTTDVATDIKPQSLTVKADSLLVDYTVVLGKKQSYSSRPTMLLKASRKWASKHVAMRPKYVQNDYAN